MNIALKKQISMDYSFLLLVFFRRGDEYLEVALLEKVNNYISIKLNRGLKPDGS